MMFFLFALAEYRPDISQTFHDIFELTQKKVKAKRKWGLRIRLAMWILKPAPQVPEGYRGGVGAHGVRWVLLAGFNGVLGLWREVVNESWTDDVIDMRNADSAGTFPSMHWSSPDWSTAWSPQFAGQIPVVTITFHNQIKKGINHVQRIKKQNDRSGVPERPRAT